MRLRGPNWQRYAFINGTGAVTTGIVLVIVTVTKFARGAWIVILAIPIIVGFFLAVHRHYQKVHEILRARRLDARAEPRNIFLVLVDDLGPAILDVVRYLRAVRAEEVVPLFTGPPDRFEEISAAWRNVAPRLGELELLGGGGDHLSRGVKRYLRDLPRSEGDFVTVVIPELLVSTSWLQFLRRRRALLLKSALLFEPGVVVTDVPLVPEELERSAASHAEHPTEVVRHVVVVPVSGVHDATVRAVVYAKSLRPSHVEGLFFMGDPRRVRRWWMPGTPAGWTSPSSWWSRPSATWDAAAGGDPQTDASRRHDRDGGPARAHPGSLVGEPAAQPDRLLHQAAAPVRARGRGHQRSVPPADVADRGPGHRLRGEAG
jgi:hypothetical protein